MEAVWGTFGAEKTVLLVARTLTSTNRLLDAIDLFRGDFRVRLLFTANDTSHFAAGVDRLLYDAGVNRIIPWSAVPGEPTDLAISASEAIDFTALAAPVVVLPHGVGFNKYVPDADGTGTRLAGLPPDADLRSGRVTVVLSHPEQENQLRAACPDIAGHTVITGDPTYDRLIASLPLRSRYRRHLGVDRRRLILVCSTWRGESALGRWRTLPHELLAALPADEYRVAIVLHPNIWSWYGAAQIRVWLADSLDAGLLLIPPHTGWQAAMVAADQVISDHGSLSLYAAAIGKPVLLAAFGEETVPGTPMDAFGATAERLDPRLDLRRQLDAGMATHVPGRFAAITDRVFADVGDATRLLRDELYQQLDLTPLTAEPPVLRVPDPEPDCREVCAFRVSAIVTADGAVVLQRFPASVRPDGDRHLAVDEAEANLRRSEQASVLTRRELTDRDTARAWAGSALRDYPGARLAAAATEDGCEVALRDGSLVSVTSGGDTMVLASAIYALDRAGRLDEGGLIIRSGVGMSTAALRRG